MGSSPVTQSDGSFSGFSRGACRTSSFMSFTSGGGITIAQAFETRPLKLPSRVDHHTTAFRPRDADQHLVLALGGATSALDLPGQPFDLAGPAESLLAPIGRPR